MSDKPSILEGGSSRNFNPVDVLSINKQSDGLSTWVLYDSVEVGSLDASQNGLYLAIEDDYFAYDQIVVNVSDDLADADDATKATGKIVGKDPDLDPNNDYAVGLDEEGNLTKEMVPAAIHIVIPPRKRKYLEGETLDFSGIHVYLMDGNNHRYTDSNYPTGEIPFDELIFPITAVEGGAETYWVGDGINAIELTYVDHPYGSTMQHHAWYAETSVGYNEYGDVYPGGGNGEATVLLTKYNGYPYICRIGGDNISCGIYGYIRAGEGITFIGGTSARSILNKFDTWPWTEYSQYLPESTKDPTKIDVADLQKKSGQDIPVQWMRSDGAILEDTFTIEVGESEEGEEQPDPWGGYADVSYGGHHYNLNRRIVPEVHYANGYCWQEGTSEYTVEQAASMGWLILIR